MTISKRSVSWIAIAMIAIVVLVLLGTAMGAGRPEASSSGSGTAALRSNSFDQSLDVASPGLVSTARPATNPSEPPSGPLEPLGTLLAMLPLAPENRSGYERS